MMGAALYRWLHRVWYGDAHGGWLLQPLSAVYCLSISCRQLLYNAGVFSTTKTEAPVIVVGNITAGGTGKTPVVIWLVNELTKRGLRPGIVSRGYGGSHSGASMRVDRNSDPATVGDEPVLLASRCKCPVVVDADRVRAVEMLVDDDVNVIVADDGLQHSRLQRDVEICVIDGSRGLGNRRLLPAGPLRESVQRLESVDQVLSNGAMRRTAVSSNAEQNAIVFNLVATEARRLNGSLTRALQHFSGSTVHAVAGIGNPGRFFDTLRSFGIQVIEHALQDHASIIRSDLEFGDNFDVLMTEKDAVKLSENMSDRFWSVAVNLSIDDALASPFLAQIESRIRSRIGCSDDT